MRLRALLGNGHIARLLLIACLVTWAVVSYLHGLVHADPAPALHGAGLVLVVSNLVTAALLAAGTWAGRRPRSRWRGPANAVLVVAGASSLVLYGVAPDTGGSFTFTLLIAWLLLARLPLPWGFGLAVTGAAATAALGSLYRDGGTDLGLLVAFAGLILGAIANRQGEAAQEATRRAEAANAVLAERSRIAREIHDILAHSLSAQIVHLEGARLLLSRDGDRVQALDRVERARNLARSGLEETRRALATLRGEIPEPKEVLAELAEEFYAGTGRTCDVRVTGTPRELSAQAGLAVVRTAQEALTNVRKHAPGARAGIVLRYLHDAVELEVTDTGGTEHGLALDGGGYGLMGMRERAELIDGTLETGPRGEGFRVALRVPA